VSNTAPQYWVIVPAAGVGSRMGADRPKQYLPLLGKTVLEHTLTRLSALPMISAVVVCVAASDPYWPSLSVPAQVRWVDGGAERCHSVLNGLRSLAAQAQEEDWVLVHDAARPCVRSADIKRLIDSLQQHPVGGLLAMPVRDTLKRADAQQQVSATVERNGLWHALTPQMFRYGALRDALEQALAAGTLVTDEAQALELCGAKPLLVAGHADNIKITHPQDLVLAERYLSQQAADD